MDKKIRDNEIKKALECCSKGIFNCDGECPRSYNNSLSISACRFELLGYVLDLLNRKDAEIEQLRDLVIEGGREQDRLMAEIERLKKEATEQQLRKEMHRLTVDEVKSEAIKEFAERLCEDRVSNDPVVIAVKAELKEMTGQNDFKE